MYILIVTGGIGSGKSTVSKHLEQCGALRVDTDAIAREVREDPSIIRDLTDCFGVGIIGGNGAIDPAVLARKAFSAPEATAALNGIMHPAILARTIDIVMDTPCFVSEGPALAVVEVPLLISGSPYLDMADEVMAVIAPVELRVLRTVARGMNEDDVRCRVMRQIGDGERAALADTVVSNDGTREELLAKVDAWYARRGAAGWKSLRKRA